MVNAAFRQSAISSADLSAVAAAEVEAFAEGWSRLATFHVVHPVLRASLGSDSGPAATINTNASSANEQAERKTM